MKNSWFFKKFLISYKVSDFIDCCLCYSVSSTQDIHDYVSKTKKVKTNSLTWMKKQYTKMEIISSS